MHLITSAHGTTTASPQGHWGNTGDDKSPPWTWRGCIEQVRLGTLGTPVVETPTLIEQWLYAPTGAALPHRDGEDGVVTALEDVDDLTGDPRG